MRLPILDIGLAMKLGLPKEKHPISRTTLVSDDVALLDMSKSLLRDVDLGDDTCRPACRMQQSLRCRSDMPSCTTRLPIHNLSDSYDKIAYRDKFQTTGGDRCEAFQNRQLLVALLFQYMREAT